MSGDNETVVLSAPPKMTPDAPPNGSTSLVRPTDVMKYRSELLNQYYGAPSLVERLKKAGKDDPEGLVVALVEEVIKESDHLLGNELVATHDGNRHIV